MSPFKMSSSLAKNEWDVHDILFDLHREVNDTVRVFPTCKKENLRYTKSSSGKMLSCHRFRTGTGGLTRGESDNEEQG
jgi:hypothetical protein